MLAAAVSSGAALANKTTSLDEMLAMVVTTALTAPFAIIAIPKHEGSVEFVDETVK